ncbi:MAG: hypothetical protein FJ215_08815 [Ignavibacteria bacterium]|nr:hypothetical protein [Ignavibacteria bacterium]
MKRTTLLWILAVIITIPVSYFQRVTGPTYRLAGSVTFDEVEIPYRLERSHGGEQDAPVRIRTSDPDITGTLEWKRHKTQDPWRKIEMQFSEGELVAYLPHQPPAGKLEYRIRLSRGENTALIPHDAPVVIRFKGEIPPQYLYPHILVMIIAFLFSTRAGLEYFSGESLRKEYVLWTVGMLFVGGLVLGPVVQFYAFDSLWTGWPLGTDLTDNKTAVAFIGWLVAALAIRKSRNPRRWVLGAALLAIAVYLIPHSLFGSELDYSTLDSP